MEQTPPLNVHATAIAHAGAGCLILGPSGSGKSRLAAEAMMLGAKLIGDDQIVLTQQSGLLTAAAAKPTASVLELRGMGLVRVSDPIARHVIHLVIELAVDADARLPEQETREFAGVFVPYLRLLPVPHTGAASLLLYLKAMQEGRILPTDWRPAA